MDKNNIRLIWIVFMASTSLMSSSPIVFVNAKIYDGNRHINEADAVYVEQGKIAKIGTHSSLKLAKNTRIVDVKGGRLMPGFIEAHAHLLGIGQNKVNLDFRNKTLDEIITMLKTQAKKQPAGSWIEGRNWNHAILLSKNYSASRLLEQVSKTHPIALKRVDGHVLWVNDRALKMANITSSTPDPAGGTIVKDDVGEPTGILIDHAVNLVSSVMKKPKKSELERFLKLGQREALQHGITSIHDAGANKETLDLYKEHAKNGKLKLRIYAMIDGQDEELVEQYLKAGPVNEQDFLSIRSIKYFADGAMGSRGALLFDDYEDDKGNRGLALLDREALKKKTIRALKSGFQVATHAIGDAANRLVLDAYESAQQELNNKDGRLRIEHVQLVDEDDQIRFKKNHIIASMQPVHCTSDMAWMPDRLSIKRIKNRAFPWRTFIDQGVKVAFGSDSPVEPINPIMGIFAATTQQNEKFLPQDGYMPKEKLTLKEALNGFYNDAAYAEFAEKKKGKISEGYLADFVIFKEDILALPKKDFIKASPEMTIVGGEVFFQAAH